LLQVHETICGLRPLEQRDLSPQEKKRRKRFNKKSPKK